MRLAVLLLLALACVSVQCALTISNTLGSNMVLQRAPLQASIWGWADAGATVTAALAGPTTQTVSAKADTTGAFRITFAAVNAGGPYTIAVSTSAGDKASMDNILFGDVWLCGGQSNMQFTVDLAFNATAEVAQAANYPNIRVFTVGTNNISATPLPELASFIQPWSVANSQSIGGSPWAEFSAVCWFFGRDLYDTYKVPIGLINSNWGGTYIQAWSSPAALAKCPSADMPETGKVAGPNPNQPSVLWNAMIVPFLPGTIAGAIWYQGEANVGGATQYACQEPAMIEDWRANFGNGYKFPFFFVQLAPWIAGSDTSIPDQRQAQLAGLAVPGVGFATAVDLGDPTSPEGNIHPRDKQDVGARLVLAARAIAYGENNVVWQGPTFDSASASFSGSTATITLNFKLYGTGSLVFKNATCPTDQGVPANNCENWSVSFSDGVWVPAASAKESGSQVTVTAMASAGSVKVLGVRYAYSSWPVCTLFSEQNLPVIPFEYIF